MIRVAVVAPHRQRCSIADYVRLHEGQFPGDIRIIDIALPEPDAHRKAWPDAARGANRADLVHVHFEYGLFDPVKPYRNRYARFMRRLRPPRIVTLHDGLPELRPRWQHTRPYRFRDGLRDLVYLPWFSPWNRRIHRLASHYIVHTEALRRRTAEQASSDHVTFLPMPIPAVKDQWHANRQSFGRLITPGFIKPHKGYEEFLPILAGHDAWHWTIAGGVQDERDKGCLAGLKDAIARQGLEDRATLTGYIPRERMNALMARSVLAVFPFQWAAGSSSIAWAIAAGMPVAATDLPAVRHLQLSGAGIELLPAGDRSAWATRLRELLENRARLSALADRNIAYAEQHGFGQLAANTARLYRGLVAQ